MQVFYSGNVQGVGFRYTVKSVATGFEVIGSVRNLPDGSVEAVFEGPRPLVERLRLEAPAVHPQDVTPAWARPAGHHAVLHAADGVSGLALAQAPSGPPIRIGSTLALTGPLSATAQVHKIVGEIYVRRDLFSVQELFDLLISRDIFPKATGIGEWDGAGRRNQYVPAAMTIATAPNARTANQSNMSGPR